MNEKISFMLSLRYFSWAGLFFRKRRTNITTKYDLGTYNYVPFETYSDILSVEDLRKALNIGRSTAYKLIDTHAIDFIRIGTAIKIPKAALISYVEENLEMCYDKICNGLANQAVGKGLM